MAQNAVEHYKDYWTGVEDVCHERQYYDRLYEKVRSKLRVEEGWRVLDVAGGNGQLMRYLGIRQADILDISESGLEATKKAGFHALRGDIEKHFPVGEESYDAVFLFEVLEHLYRPGKTLAEAHHVLKPEGILYVGQPNMRVDGTHHVRRYYLKSLLSDLEKAGFEPEWIDHVPAYSMRDSIASDIARNPSWIRKAVQCVNWTLSLLPYGARYQMAKIVPDRFALMFIIKAVKKGKAR